ncbi:hypothetical protein HDU67_004946 [Dinochytrium kinnereticum]|nr:hypothetical protein HDU67_004946 [Dinochytrium kinnereticum]
MLDNDGDGWPMLSPQPSSTAPASSSSSPWTLSKPPTHPPIAILPDEILIQSLANLDPYHLRLAACVCRRWNTVINDDASWRCALECNLKALPFRRVSRASWRMEYLRRNHLQREWQRNIGKRVVQFDPRVGRIHCAFVEMDDDTPRMIIGSIDRGTAVVCNASTGRIEKDMVHFSPEMNPMEIADLQYDNQYNTVLSGGFDGQVRIWNVASGRVVAVCTGNTSPIASLASDPKQFVAAGTMDGKIHLWSMNAAIVQQCFATSSSGTASPATSTDLLVAETFQHFSLPSSRDGDRRIITLFLDVSLSILISLCECRAVEAGSAVRIWNVAAGNESGVRLGISNFSAASIGDLKVNHDGHMGSITSIQWDRPTVGPTDRKSSILVTGDDHGRVCLWELYDTALQASSTSPTFIQPLRTIQAHPSPISTLQMDPFKLITGSTTGSLKIFDITTGALLKSLNLRRGAEVGDHGANGLDRRSISYVWSGEWRLIAVANGSVRAWDFKAQSGASAPVSRVGRHRRRAARNRFDAARTVGTRQSLQQGGGGGGGGGGGALSKVVSPKAQINLTVKSELREYEMQQRLERREDARREREWAKLHGRVNGELTGMSEEEIMNYAVMLSMETGMGEEQTVGGSADFVPETEAEAIAIAESLSLASSNPHLSSSLSQSPPNDRHSIPRTPAPNHATSSASSLASGVSTPSTSRTSTTNHRASSGAWYDDDWDFDRDVLDDSELDDWCASHHLSAQSSRQSLTIPISPTSAPHATPLSYAAVAHRRSTSSLTGGGRDWSDDEEDEGRGAGPDRQRYVFGTIGGGAVNGGGGGPVLLRSPRLGPLGTHISPRLMGGVNVASRATEADVDQELMYVLELSMVEK